MSENNISFPRMEPFDFYINHVSLKSDSIANVSDSHIHEQCEIYINVTGNVSFMVEDSLYPISHGDAIITRPYEYHHCIYNSKADHEHFWILFSPTVNTDMLDMFFDRPQGTGNLVRLSKEKAEELILICKRINEKHQDTLYQYINFLKILLLLKECISNSIPDMDEALPHELQSLLKIIDSEYMNHIDIKSLAQQNNVSVNTLERYFKKHIMTTPREYITNRRLAAAGRLLRTTDKSILSISEECGFCDCSYFITQFKKLYNTTPMRYRNRLPKSCAI